MLRFYGNAFAASLAVLEQQKYIYMRVVNIVQEIDGNFVEHMLRFTIMFMCNSNIFIILSNFEQNYAVEK